MVKRTNLRGCLIIAVFLLGMVSVAGGRTIYVDDDANGLNDGSSWTNAYNYLWDALFDAAASSGNEIWVAQGIYKPDEGGSQTPGDRKATFWLSYSVAIKGGYAGFGQPDPNERDIDKYKTILSGDLAGNDEPDFVNYEENSYHVVRGSGCDRTTILDGFTITAGNANGEIGIINYISGGGMYNGGTGWDPWGSPPGSPTVINCTFIANSASRSGGGVDNGGGGLFHGRPMLINCKFIGNYAGYDGGGMYNGYKLIGCKFSYNSSDRDGGGLYNGRDNLILTNCKFTGNSAEGDGGGMVNFGSGSILTNCVFSGNSAERGGGIHEDGVSTSLTNCTFAGNSATNGSGLACDSYNQKYPSDVNLNNCILWDSGDEIYNNDNSTILITYSDVRGGWPGEGNIDVDPCFVAPGYWEAILPGPASNPYPPDGATDVSILSDLSWMAGANATSHDVYFGTSSMPPFIGNQTSTVFDPGTMATETTYYWYIDEINISGKTPGEVWSFTTMTSLPPPPFPLLPTYLNLDDTSFFFWIDGDYNLPVDSPCINAGDPNYKAEFNETDFDGKPRLMRGRIDMGAYELYSSGIIYVDNGANGANNGTSWRDAYKHLQDALTSAWIGDEIHVAQGTYKPDEADHTLIAFGDREAAFRLKSGVAVRGGYAGFGEQEPNERDIQKYESVLSGDLDGDDVEGLDPCDLKTEPTRAENSYNIVNVSFTDDGALLDGFTIIGGNANGPVIPGYPHYDYSLRVGGAMYIDSSSLCLTDCTFIENSAFLGGGIYNINSTLTLTNCTFIANYGEIGGGMFNSESGLALTNCTYSGNSANYGGGIFNEGSNPTLINCTFTANRAYTGDTLYANILQGSGGGMLNSFSSPTLTNCTFNGNFAIGDAGGIFNFIGSNSIATNCTFSGNVACNRAGAMYNWRNSPTITNCTFSGNLAGQDGGALCNIGSDVTLINCILWGDTATEGNEIYAGLYTGSWGREYLSTTSVDYSDIAGGAAGIYVVAGCTLNWGEGNIDADPCFIKLGYWIPCLPPMPPPPPPIPPEPPPPPIPTQPPSGQLFVASIDDVNQYIWIEGDYRLLPGSPCIDAGDPDYVAEPNEMDLDGNRRVIGGRIDMGAYEFQNTPPVADAGPDQTVECTCNTDEGTKVTLDGTGSYDADGDPLTYTWTGPFVESPANGATPTVTLEGGCPGEYVITLIVNDGTECSEPNDVVITVVDTTAPEFALVVSPMVLWPPSHKMVKITPSWTVSDKCDATPEVSLVGILVNEADDAKGTGNSSDDIQIGDDGSICLRAERSGKGGDRIYTITYKAVDDCGNTTIRSATVTVPHDRR